MKLGESNDGKKSTVPALPHGILIGKWLAATSKEPDYLGASFFVPRQARQTKPKLSDGRHGGDEVRQVAGLAHITVRSQFIAVQNVLRRLGGAEDRNRYLPQQRVGFDLRQNRATVLAGEV